MIRSIPFQSMIGSWMYLLSEIAAVGGGGGGGNAHSVCRLRIEGLYVRIVWICTMIINVDAIYSHGLPFERYKK